MTTNLIGFARLTPEQRRENARKGGLSVNPRNRPWYRDPSLAVAAGSKGGKHPKPRKEKSE